MVPGLRSRICATYSLVHGGAPTMNSMSNATSTASTPAPRKSAATSASVFSTQSCFQYAPSASANGPCEAIHSRVPG